MKPKTILPRVFSQAFNNLVDILIDDLNETDRLNWLSKRNLIKTTYPKPGLRKPVLTTKALDYINSIKKQGINEEEIHEDGTFVVILLIHLKEKEKYTNLNPKSDKFEKIIKRLRFLELITSKNNVTEHGNNLIELYYKTNLVKLILNTDMLDSEGEPYVWWSDWLIANAPISNWAEILVNSKLPENIKDIYQDKIEKYLL